jgi:glycosyltransferase involved in cell wall biosynthesis
MRNTKILFFISGTYISGLEIVTLHLIKGLKERGYTIECVISGWNNNDFKERLKALEVPYHEIKLGWIYIRKPKWTIDSLIHYPKAYLKCRRIIKKFNPDICHFCSFSIPILIFPLIKTRSVFNLQESLMPTRKHALIFNLLNKKISAFTAVSNHIVSVLKKLNISSEKIKLIYNGMPLVELPKPNNGNSILHIGIIGQIVEWKGHHNLLLAVERLVADGIYNFKVFIYGNDRTDYGDGLKKIIKEKKLENYFSWEGFVKNQNDIYSNCEIVVVPTLSGEPCSLTIIESMSYGKALIVSDRGGNPELVDNEKNGLIFKAEDPIDLYECTLKFINNTEFRVSLASNAREKALSNFGYLRMTDQYIDVYEQAVAKQDK